MESEPAEENLALAPVPRLRYSIHATPSCPVSELVGVQRVEDQSEAALELAAAWGSGSG